MRYVRCGSVGHWSVNVTIRAWPTAIATARAWYTALSGLPGRATEDGSSAICSDSSSSWSRARSRRWGSISSSSRASAHPCHRPRRDGRDLTCAHGRPRPLCRAGSPRCRAALPPTSPATIPATRAANRRPASDARADPVRAAGRQRPRLHHLRHQRRRSTAGDRSKDDIRGRRANGLERISDRAGQFGRPDASASSSSTRASRRASNWSARTWSNLTSQAPGSFSAGSSRSARVTGPGCSRSSTCAATRCSRAGRSWSSKSAADGALCSTSAQ